jgi:hypothetical protein
MYCQRLDKNGSVVIRIVGSGEKSGLCLLRRVDNLIRKRKQQLCQTTLSCGIITQHRGEGSIAERFGQALAEGFTSSGVVTETMVVVRTGLG